MVLPQIDYDDSVPTTGHVPSADYSTMQANAVADVNIWATDHIGFGTPGSGYHQQVRMPNYTVNSISPNPPTVVAGFGGLYADNTTSTGVSTETGLWYTPDVTGNAYQLTRTITGSFSLFSANTNNYNATGTQFNGGWTFLPGGLLMQYGQYYKNTGIVGSTGTVTFPVSFSAAPYNISLTLICKSTMTSQTQYLSVLDTFTSSTSFQWNLLSTVGGSYVGFYWTAIGK